MSKKLYISLIFSNLVVFKTLSPNHRMYNLYTKFVKILEICKQFSENLVNESGNVPRRGPVPKFSIWKWWRYPWRQKQRALIVRSGCSTINCKITRTTYQIHIKETVQWPQEENGRPVWGTAQEDCHGNGWRRGKLIPPTGIETIFSQLTDQFLVIRNYAKITNALFARIIGKISALTILQYVNFINDKPIGRIKYALN